MKIPDQETIELIRENGYNSAILDVLEILGPKDHHDIWMKVKKLYKIETEINKPSHEIR
jgi:hypothetical protein